METIQALEQRLEEAQSLLVGLDASQDFASRMSRQSMEHHISDLQQQLRVAKEEREKEVVELRLMGRLAQEGSLPLPVLADIAGNLSKALYAASYYIRSGKEIGNRIPADIKHLLDLRLADLRSGSTRVFVTGMLSPDLFGNSLLENSLDGAFRLLNAESSDELEEAASNVGIRSARRVHNLLDALDKAGLEAVFEWVTPGNEERVWNGNAKSIRRISSSLKQLKVKDPEYFNVTGQLVTLSLKGKFEIRVPEEVGAKTYQGTFPTRLLDTVKQFHIGDEVLARIEARKIVNEATGAVRVRYNLDSLGQPSDLYAPPDTSTA